MASTVLQVRIDESLKKETEEIFRKIGLNMSAAVKLFLNRVAIEKGIPFSMNVLENDNKEPVFDPVSFIENRINKNDGIEK